MVASGALCALLLASQVGGSTGTSSTAMAQLRRCVGLAEAQARELQACELELEVQADQVEALEAIVAEPPPAVRTGVQWPAVLGIAGGALAVGLVVGALAF